MVVLPALVQVHADDQGHDPQQAQSGQQHDLQANGERVEHGGDLAKGQMESTDSDDSARQVHFSAMSGTSARAIFA
ncbi:hypothetical protein P308_24760 [Pseudomonas piscis]|nr:hypothetical protein P308_24760 [Pseudomonas piscis]